MSPFQNEKGFVLIYILLLSVTITAIVMVMTKKNKNIIKIQSLYETQLSLEHQIDSFTKIANDLILNKEFLSGFSHKIDDTTIQIRNANAYLNINYTTADEIRHLCLLLKIDEERSHIISDSILDWIDKNNEPGVYGAENVYYANLEKPYNCKNGPISNCNELLLIRGINRMVLNKLKHYICFNNSGINFQIAPGEVIESILGNPNTTQLILDHRKEDLLKLETIRMIIGDTQYNTLIKRLNFDNSKTWRLKLTAEKNNITMEKITWVTRL